MHSDLLYVGSYMDYMRVEVDVMVIGVEGD